MNPPSPPSVPLQADDQTQLPRPVGLLRIRAVLVLWKMKEGVPPVPPKPPAFSLFDLPAAHIRHTARDQDHKTELLHITELQNEFWTIKILLRRNHTTSMQRLRTHKNATTIT